MKRSSRYSRISQFVVPKPGMLVCPAAVQGVKPANLARSVLVRGQIKNTWLDTPALRAAQATEATATADKLESSLREGTSTHFSLATGFLPLGQ